jgi:cytochrome c oxidase subunit 2
MDAVPGRYTDLWFRATKAGTYPVFCAEYCGTSHSDMLSNVVVHPPGGYEKWVAEQIDIGNSLPPVELGKRVYEKQGCNACHTVDGTPKIGPTWKGIWGKNETLVGGRSVKVDENYIRDSILDPAKDIVAPFPPSMPVTKLSDREITGIIEYIKSLK